MRKDEAVFFFFHIFTYPAISRNSNDDSKKKGGGEEKKNLTLFLKVKYLSKNTQLEEVDFQRRRATVAAEKMRISPLGEKSQTFPTKVNAS